MAVCYNTTKNEAMKFYGRDLDQYCKTLTTPLACVSSVPNSMEKSSEFESSSISQTVEF